MATATLKAIGHAILNQENPTLTVDPVDGFLATGYFSGTPQTNRALLMFDLQRIPRDATVTSAVLKITVNNNFLGQNHTLNIFRLKRKWWGNQGIDPIIAVDKASWTNFRQDLGPNAWTTGGAGSSSDRETSPIGSVAITAATSGQITITLDTTLVQEWVSGDFVNYGLALIASDESTPETLMRWESALTATQANRPVLEITYTPVAHSLSDGLVAFLELDSLNDGSGNSHTLTAHGSPSFVPAVVGNGASLDGASYFTNPDAAFKFGDGDFTIGVWVNLTDKLDFYAIFSQQGSDVKGYRLFYHKQAVLDYFVAQLLDGSSAVISDIVGLNAGNPSAGTDYFITIRHDSVRNHYQMFLNGSAIMDTAGHHDTSELSYGTYGPYTGTPAVSSGSFQIGADLEGAQYYFKGVLDQLIVYNRCLADDEIDALYNSGAGISAADIVEPTPVPTPVSASNISARPILAVGLLNSSNQLALAKLPSGGYIDPDGIVQAPRVLIAGIDSNGVTTLIRLSAAGELLS